MLRLLCLFVISFQLSAKLKGIQYENIEDSNIGEEYRTCCALTTAKVAQFVGVANWIGTQDLGVHQFVFNNEFDWDDEGNGLIKTCRAGLIDTVHLRMTADYAAHIFVELEKGFEEERNFEFSGPFFDGTWIKIEKHPGKNLSREDLATIASYLGYQVMLWHEISTAFNTIGFELFQRGSAFSPEDAYSNALGAKLAYESIVSNGDYNEQMTWRLRYFLQRSIAVQTGEETFETVKRLTDVWWKPLYSIGPRDETLIALNTALLVRDFDILSGAKVYMLPDDHLNKCPLKTPMPSIELKQTISTGENISVFARYVVDTNMFMRKKLREYGLEVGDEFDHRLFSRLIEISKRVLADAEKEESED